MSSRLDPSTLATTSIGPSCAFLVGVHGRVDARLRDDRLRVGDAGLVHPDRLREPGHRVAHEADVLSPRRENEAHDRLLRAIVVMEPDGYLLRLRRLGPGYPVIGPAKPGWQHSARGATFTVLTDGGLHDQHQRKKVAARHDAGDAAARA